MKRKLGRPAARPTRISRKETPARTPRWLRPVVVALSVLLLVALTSSEVGDPDTWQHLASGRYILQHHAFPTPDPFAFTTQMVKPAYPDEEATRRFNIKHELLAQIVFYLAYTLADFAGLVLLRCTLLAAFCGFIGLAAGHRTHSFYRGFAAAAMAAIVTVPFQADRPYLFTFAFLAALIAILEYRRWLWILPVLFLVCANSHGGFIMGWAVLVAYCGEALFLRWRGQPPADERRLWLVAAVSILISGCNATGFQVVPVMLAYRKSFTQTTLWDWQSPLLWPPGPVHILLTVAAVVLLWARRRTRPVDWLLLGLFGTAALMALRNTILAGLVAPLLIVTYLPWQEWVSPRLKYRLEYLTALLALAATVVMVLQGRAFQFRAADWKYPTGAADFMLAHHITAPMFNTYESGAYLIWRLWPGERVFIDGRAQSETVYLDYKRILHAVAVAPFHGTNAYQSLRPQRVGGRSAEDLLRQYGVEVILMGGFEYIGGGPYLLAAVLADPDQTEWKLVYHDAQAMIFMRNPPVGVPPLPPLEALTSLEAQCAERISHEPASPRCAASLSYMFAGLGDRERARRWHGIAAGHGI